MPDQPFFTGWSICLNVNNHRSKIMNQYDQYLENNMKASIQELTILAAQPSVSAQNWGLIDCAKLVKSMLEKRGFKVELLTHKDSAPVVFGQLKGRTDKTLLIYNHYDVQPVEPLDLWQSPPFEPQVRDGKLFGRGVNDDKGHFVNRLFAIDAIIAKDGMLPCNIKWVLEGEEETTSEALHEVVRADPQKFNADACIWEFGGVDDKDRPMEYLGLRGICYVELSVETANQDVHSGLGGSIMPNAAWRLVWALDSLKGPDENIRIAGFYNKVKPVSAKTRILLEALPDEAEQLIQQYGIKSFLKGIKGGSELRLAEAHEPTCTICGLNSGYQGEGAKTVQPARASAKVDFRLVPDQVPEEIFELLRAHLDRNGFEDVKIVLLGKERPAVTDPEHPFVDLVVETAREVYGMPMQIVPSVGGSGPNSIFKEYLDFPIVSAGIGYPAMQAHAPNENVRLDLYLKGAKHIIRIIEAFSSDAFLV
jgi:acetylornithine deacetylase/succinyl-diaminopimelate desuccinylase-like protein